MRTAGLPHDTLELTPFLPLYRSPWNLRDEGKLVLIRI
jgi:hypothetical protein